MSPDGRYFWSGTEWVPVTWAPAPAVPNPYSANPYDAGNPYAAPSPSAAPSPYAAPSLYGAPSPYGAANPFAAPYFAPQAENERFAVVSLVLGLLFFFGVTAPCAVIFGHIALHRIKRTTRGGQNMAIAGLVLGYLGIAFFALIIAIPIVTTTGYRHSSVLAHSSSVRGGDDDVSSDLRLVSSAETMYAANNITFSTNADDLFSDPDLAPSGDNDIFVAVGSTGYCVLGSSPDSPTHWFLLDSSRGVNGGNTIDLIDGPIASKQQAEMQCTGVTSPHFVQLSTPSYGNAA